MLIPGGVEPPTFGFVDRCSIPVDATECKCLTLISQALNGATDRSRTCMNPITFHLVRSEGGYRCINGASEGNRTLLVG